MEYPNKVMKKFTCPLFKMQKMANRKADQNR